MNPIQKPYQNPIITGRGSAPAATRQQRTQQPVHPTQNFQTLLEKTLHQKEAAQELTFSKHAQQRTQERNIALSENDLARLDQAVGKAEDKGLKDTLVFMDDTAFIVNVPSRVVVTVVAGGEEEHAVFTNIDGAVIV